MNTEDLERHAYNTNTPQILFGGQYRTTGGSGLLWITYKWGDISGNYPQWTLPNWVGNVSHY